VRLGFLVACWGQVNYAIFGSRNGDRCATGANRLLPQELALIIMDFFVYSNKANSNRAGIPTKSLMSADKTTHTHPHGMWAWVAITVITKTTKL